MPTVEIKGFGIEVEFPDSMTDDEITAALRDRVMPQLQQERAASDRQALEAMTPYERAQVLERHRNGGAQTVGEAMTQLSGAAPAVSPPAGALTSTPDGAAPGSRSFVQALRDTGHNALVALGEPARQRLALPGVQVALNALGTLPTPGPNPAAVLQAYDKAAAGLLPEDARQAPEGAGAWERALTETALPGLAAFADPVNMGAMIAGGAAAAPVAGALGLGEVLASPVASAAGKAAARAMQAGLGGAGALGAFGGVEAAQRGESPAGIALAAGKSAATGLELGATAGMPGGALGKLLGEVGIFGLAAPAMEGRMPTEDDLVGAIVMIGGLNAARGLSPGAIRGLLKRREDRTPEEAQAVEAVPPEQMQAVVEELAQRDPGLATIHRAERIAREEPTRYQVQEAGGVPKATPLPRETPDQTKRLLAQVPDDVLLSELAREQQSDSRRRLLQEEFDRRTAAPEPEPQGEINQADILARQKKGRRLALAQSPTRSVTVGALKAGDRVKTVQGDGKVVKVTQNGVKVVTDAGATVSLFRGQRVRRYGEAGGAGAPEFSAPQERPAVEPRPLETALELQDYQEIVDLVPERAAREAVPRETPAEPVVEPSAPLGENAPPEVPISPKTEVVSRETPAEPAAPPVEPTPAPEAPALPQAAPEAPPAGKVPAPAAEGPQGAAGAPIDLAARRAARPTGEEGHLNLGTSKPAKPSLKATAAAAGEFQPESKWGGDWWTEGLQNSLIRLYRLEKWGRIKGATAWLGRKAEAYIGRAGHRIEKAQAELEGILKPAFDAGFKPSELGRYMQALHVEERQATMIERGFKGDAAAGMTVAEAKKVIASMPPEIAEHAAKLRAYIDGTLDILVEGQLIPAEVAAEWRQRWPNYVPLLRDFGAGEAVSPDGGGRGFGASAGVKRAKGSKREALPVLAQVATARARAIDLAERGRVGRELLKTIEETGLEKQGWRVEDAESFFVDKDGELMLREATKDMKNKDNVISVPVEGRTVKIVIPPDQQGIIRAMNGLGVERSIPVLREVNQYLRYMATTGNLEFLVTNFSRDLQEAQIHLAEKGPKVQAEVLRNLPAALKGIADHLAGRDTEWARAREEMAAAGGLTHWSKPARDINKMAAEIEKMAERIETAKTPETRIANGARLIGRGIEGMNEVVEGGVRLSAYRALRRAGVGAEEAALFAKNMTLNFDKKGRWGGLIGSAYLFFTVGVQGPVRMAQFAKKNPGKFASIASGIAVAGYLEAMHNHSANPEEYEKRSTWERDNFWSFMRPGPNGAAAVMRVPYGYNFFKAIGATGYDVQAGLMSERDATNRAFKALVDGFSPVDDILPSALAPFIQIRMNKNWFGGPIRPEQPAYSAKVPDSQLYFKSARPQSVSLAKRLNEMTGGNEVLSGWFDVSPENMDYLVDFAGGGVGKLAGRTTSTLTSLARGDEIDPNQVPFARQFYRVSAKGRERSEVYHMLDESGRRIFTDAQVEKFNRYLDEAEAKGQIDEKKADRYRKQFAKNQEAAVASTTEE